MRIIVDELPSYASECIFGEEKDSWGEVTCKFSNCCCELACGNKCPYLKKLKEQQNER